MEPVVMQQFLLSARRAVRFKSCKFLQSKFPWSKQKLKHQIWSWWPLQRLKMERTQKAMPEINCSSRECAKFKLSTQCIEVKASTWQEIKMVIMVACRQTSSISSKNMRISQVKGLPCSLRRIALVCCFLSWSDSKKSIIMLSDWRHHGGTNSKTAHFHFEAQTQLHSFSVMSHSDREWLIVARNWFVMNSLPSKIGHHGVGSIFEAEQITRSLVFRHCVVHSAATHVPTEPNGALGRARLCTPDSHAPVWSKPMHFLISFQAMKWALLSLNLDKSHLI